MTILRNMQCDDLRQVNLILSKAFTHAIQKEGKFVDRIPLCRPEFLEMYLDANPEGCFVIENKGKVLAYSFSRLWGKVGWIGPLSVLPSEQSRGYGKHIVRAAVEYLKGKKAITIGLETDADSAKNLAFYVKLGFIPQETTVDLLKTISTLKPKRRPSLRLIKYSDCSVDEKKKFLKGAAAFSKQLHRGLDYTAEIKLINKHSFGDAFLIEKSNKEFAFLIAHSATYSQEEKRFFFKVNALQLNGRLNKGVFEIVGDIIELCARSKNLPGVYVRFCTRFSHAMHYFLENGYRVVKNDLRMTLKGYPQRDNLNCINLSKWE